MDRNDNQGEQGFTLVELLIVMIIIAIISAVAIPRFLNQTSNARISALNSLAASINSAMTLFQAQYRSQGYTSNSSATIISMNGNTVTVVAGTGFPASAAGGIDAALQSYQGFVITIASNVATFDFSTPVPNCNLTYTASSGKVSVTTTGC